MSRREDIDNGIWSDPDFEALSLEATCLYLWAFTNPRCGMAGIYKVSRRAMTESKVPAEKIPAALKELSDARFCFFEDDVLFIRTRARHLRQKTEQIAKSIRSDVAKLPESHSLRAQFLAEYSSAAWLREYLSGEALETVTRGSREGHGSLPPGGNPVTLTGRSSDRQGQRQRQWKGQGPSRERVQGEGMDWERWAIEQVPDLPPMMVAMSCLKLAGGGHEVTPEIARRSCLASNPTLREAA